MICKVCLTENAPGAKTCSMCGAALETPAQQPMPQQNSAQTQPIQQPTYSNYAPSSTQAKFCGLAIAGFVTSMVGIFLFTFLFATIIPLVISVIGTILSSVGLAIIIKKGNLRGKGLAIAGLVVGIVVITLNLIIFFAVVQASRYYYY